MSGPQRRRSSRERTIEEQPTSPYIEQEIRLQVTRISTDEKPVQERKNRGDRQSDEFGETHATDQHQPKTDPQYGENNTSRQVKAFVTGELLAQHRQSRTSHYVSEKARHGGERRIPAESARGCQYPEQDSKRNNGDVRCLIAPVDGGKPVRKVALFSQGKSHAWVSDHVGRETPEGGEQCAHGNHRGHGAPAENIPRGREWSICVRRIGQQPYYHDLHQEIDGCDYGQAGQLGRRPARVLSSRIEQSRSSIEVRSQPSPRDREAPEDARRGSFEVIGYIGSPPSFRRQRVPLRQPGSRRRAYGGR